MVDVDASDRAQFVAHAQMMRDRLHTQIAKCAGGSAEKEWEFIMDALHENSPHVRACGPAAVLLHTMYMARAVEFLKIHHDKIRLLELCKLIAEDVTHLTHKFKGFDTKALPVAERATIAGALAKWSNDLALLQTIYRK